MEDSELGLPLISKGSSSGVNQSKKNELGTLMGVYIPCICSIFGVVLFERLGWLVGEAGVWATLTMFIAAFTVVFTTALSISAISTNGQMKGGGVYYMISRSLGAEFGGSIGIIFFLANITNGATFLLGFVEGLMATLDGVVPSTRWWQILYVAISLVALTVIGLLGAKVASKINSLIFVMQWVAVIIGFICVFLRAIHLGGKASMHQFSQNSLPSYSEGYNTMAVFAIAFPSVTGIMAGANMSGDLKAPHHSIPKGTLLAILTTLITYIALVLVYAFGIDRTTLQTNYFIMQDAAFNPWLIAQGIIVATLSSALACILGGARILQAIARDDLLPFLGFFKVGSKSGDEPQRAVLFSALLMFCFVLIGNLNAVLPLVSMFYFTTYGITNFACFALSLTGAPNFRPLFKYFSWWSSLLGAILCLAGMFILNPLYASLSMVLFIILWGLIHYRAPATDWGDLSQALIYHQVRKYLLMLDFRKAHIKFWRPAVLLFVDNIEQNHNLLDFTNQLKKGGLYVIASVALGTIESRGADIRDLSRRGWDIIRKAKIKGFYEMAIASSVRAGAANLTLIAGLGGMRPNTVIFGFYQDHTEQQIQSEPINSGHVLALDEYIGMLVDAILFEKNILLARNFDKMDKAEITLRAKQKKPKTIDVWNFANLTGGGADASYQLGLQLGYVLKRSEFFRKCRLRVISLVPSTTDVERNFQHIKTYLLDSRIPADDVEVVPINHSSDLSTMAAEGRNHVINETIQTYSANTAVAFMPFTRPPDTPKYYNQYIRDLDVLTKDLPPLMLVYSTTPVITSEL